jgi:Fur family ferric uptake transcriptional regulator
MDGRNQAVPLSIAGKGKYRIIVLKGGRGFVRKLAHMGLYPNAEITVISARRNGPVRVIVKGSQLVLGRGMASKILVSRDTNEEEDPDKHYTLRDYKEGQLGKIIDVKGDEKFRKRITEMGFVKGADVYVEKYAPLRDPIEFVVKGYHVGLRRNEAEKIIMTEPWYPT